MPELRGVIEDHASMPLLTTMISYSAGTCVQAWWCTIAEQTMQQFVIISHEACGSHSKFSTIHIFGNGLLGDPCA